MPAPRPLNRWVTGHARGAFANLRAPVPWPHMWVCGTAAALPIVVGLARGELRFAIYGGLAGYLMAINDHYGALRHRLLVTALSFAALVAAFVLGLQSRGSPEIFLPILGGLTYWLGLMAGSGAEAERLLLFALIDVVVVHAAPTMTAAVGPHVWPYGLLALGTLVVGQLGSDRFGRAYRSENYARLAAAFRAAWVGPGPRHVHAVNVTLATLGAAALTEYSQVERGYWMIITVFAGDEAGGPRRTLPPDAAGGGDGARGHRRRSFDFGDRSRRGFGGGRVRRGLRGAVRAQAQLLAGVLLRHHPGGAVHDPSRHRPARPARAVRAGAGHALRLRDRGRGDVDFRPAWVRSTAVTRAAPMFELYWLFATSLARAQTFDVYRPTATKPPAPVVFFVHGGAWIGGRKEQYVDLGHAFARAGMCAVVVEYRLAPEFKHPRPVEDLETARRDALKTMGPACDRARVAMVGHSAGAHALAFWSITHPDPVRALVGLEGIYDLPKLARRWPTYPDWFLTAAFGPAARWPAASPARRAIKNKAPWLLVHARGDELIDVGQTTDFAAHLKAERRAVEVFDPGTRTHFEVVDDLRVPDSAVFARITSFLKSKF